MWRRQYEINVGLKCIMRNIKSVVKPHSLYNNNNIVHYAVLYRLRVMTKQTVATGSKLLS